MAGRHCLLGNNVRCWDWEGEIVGIEEDHSSDLMNSIKITLNEKIPLEYQTILFQTTRSHRPLLCIEGTMRYNGLWIVYNILNHEKSLCCHPSHSSQESCSHLWNNQFYLHKSIGTQCTESNIQLLKGECPNSSSSSSSPTSLGRIYFAPTLVFHCLINIFNIVSIDTVNQTFHIDLYTELRLKYISDHENQEAILMLLECYQATLASIDFLNVSEIIGEKEIWTKIEPNQPGELMDFAIKIRFKALFIEKLELEDFPFDLQDLNIPLTFNASINRVALRPNLKYPSVFQVFDIYPPIRTSLAFLSRSTAFSCHPSLKWFTVILLSLRFMLVIH
jgi:hypothetical protein